MLTQIYYLKKEIITEILIEVLQGPKLFFKTFCLAADSKQKPLLQALFCPDEFSNKNSIFVLGLLARRLNMNRSCDLMRLQQQQM